MYGVKINLARLHGKAFNMDNIKRFFFCLKACKLKTRLIMFLIFLIIPYLENLRQAESSELLIELVLAKQTSEMNVYYHTHINHCKTNQLRC